MAELIATPELVLDAVLVLRAEGMPTSSRDVRERLGGGSLEKIQEILNQVLINNPVLVRKLDQECIQPIYNVLNNVLTGVIDKAIGDAKYENNALVETCMSIATEKRVEKAKTDSLADKLVAAKAEIEHLKGQIVQLEKSLAETTGKLEESKSLELRMKDWEQLKEEATQTAKDAITVEEMRETVERRFSELKEVLEMVSSSIDSGTLRSKQAGGKPPKTTKSGA